MANATILYACTERGLAIINKPGTLPEWLPPRRALVEESVTDVWAEPGPPIRVAAIAGGALQVSDNGGRTWQSVELPAAPLAIWGREGEGDGEKGANLYVAMHGGRVVGSVDAGATWTERTPLPIEITGARHAGEGPADTSLLMAFTQAGGGRLLVGDPESGSWQTPYTAATSSGAYVAGNETFYALTPSGLVFGQLNGQEWDPVPGAPTGGTTLAAIPGPMDKPPALLVGGPDGLSVSQDGGASWSVATLLANGAVVAVTRDPERRDRVYVALSSGFIYESGNRGQSWEAVNAQPLPNISVLYAIRI
jgi:hypothetical protein